MGLDSVELLITFEKEFGLEVTDYDAGEMATVGDVATWFHTHLVNSNDNDKTKTELQNKIYQAINKIGLSPNFKVTDSVNTVFEKQNLSQNWEEFQLALNLNIPKPNRYDLEDKIEKSKGIRKLFIKKRSALTSYSFERLIEWIGALNYKKLLESNDGYSLFDVFITVIYLTHDTSGVNIDEIFWDSSFTNDLGID